MLDIQCLSMTLDKLLRSHVCNELTDEDLCLHLINILHCDLLPVVHLKPPSISDLDNLLVLQGRYITDLEKEISVKTNSRYGYSKSLNKQRIQLIKKFSKSGDTTLGFCTYFGKLLLSHIVEVISLVSASHEYQLIDTSSEQYGKLLRQLKTMSTHKVCEQVDLSSKSSDMHTLVTAASNIVRRLNKEGSLTMGIKRALKSKRSLDPHQSLYVSVTKSHQQVTKELAVYMDVQVKLKQVKLGIEEMITNLRSNKCADVSLWSRKGSSRCTDLLSRKVAAKWQRPGELLHTLLENENTKVCRENTRMRKYLVQEAEDLRTKYRQAKLLRRKNSFAEMLPAGINDLQSDIVEHFKKILNLVRLEVKPKIVSQRTIWLKYEPYIFEQTLDNLCELYICSREGDMAVLESLTRDVFEQQRSSMSSVDSGECSKEQSLSSSLLRNKPSGRSKSLDPVTSFHPPLKRSFMPRRAVSEDQEASDGDSISPLRDLSALSVMMDDLSVHLKDGEDRLSCASTSSQGSEDRNQDPQHWKRSGIHYEDFDLDSLHAQEFSHKLTQDAESGIESDSDDGDDGDDYDNVLLVTENWTEYISTSITNHVVPNLILRGFVDLLHKLAASGRNVSSEQLTDHVIIVLLETEPAVRRKLYSRILFLSDYLPFFHVNNEYNYALTVVHGAFLMLLETKEST